MQIVIDTDENLYTRLFDNGVEFNTDDKYDLERSVRHGKVLPKGHGRLIDLDELMDRVGLEDNEEYRENNIAEFITMEDIDRTPILIEAEMEAET